MDPIQSAASVVAEASAAVAAAEAVAAQVIHKYQQQQQQQQQSAWDQSPSQNDTIRRSAKHEEAAFVLDPALQLELDKYNTSTQVPSPHQQQQSRKYLKAKVNKALTIPPPPKPQRPQQPTILDANTPMNSCTRCKKFFTVEPDKQYKLCEHCRDLQRQRSRRWQQRTKEKDGVCRRCGTVLPTDEGQFVLCEHCRMSLRSRKANRAAQGKCVHCSGPNDSEDGKYKVCSRCRTNDKIRRSNLERNGACNRCANVLVEMDRGHKVCTKCRAKKRRTVNDSDESPSIKKRQQVKYKTNIIKNDTMKQEHNLHDGQQDQQPSLDATAAAVAAVVLKEQQQQEQEEHQQQVDSVTAQAHELLIPDDFNITKDDDEDDSLHHLSHHHHQIPQLHHSQLNQQLNQQLHQQLHQLAASAHSSGSHSTDQGSDSEDGNEEDTNQQQMIHHHHHHHHHGVDVDDEVVGGSLTIPDPDKMCIKCGQNIHIDELSINPATNICSKCLGTSDVEDEVNEGGVDEGDDDTDANLFMNPEAVDEMGKL